MIDLPNICLIGKLGSGKTTVSNYLQKHHSYERMSFAAPLKTGCATTDDRDLLQKVGHGVRLLYPDFWVNLLVASFNALPEQRYRRVVIDDCRYPNEAEMLRGEGFVFVRVVAPVSTRRNRSLAAGRLQDEAQLSHPSETALDDFEADHRLINDGWLSDLEGDIVTLLNQVRS